MKRACLSVALVSVACLSFASSASGDTNVSIDIKPGSKPDPNCFKEGEEVEVNITLGTSASIIELALVTLNYDPSCISLAGGCTDIRAGASCGKSDGSPFDVVQECSVAGGSITIEVSASTGSTGPATLACLTFRKAPNCELCGIDGVSVNLLDERGYVVQGTLNNSKTIRRAGVITTNIPDSVVATSKTVTWDLPTAPDDCEGDLPLECTCSSSDPSFDCFTVLINNGGAFPVSQTVFECHTVGSPPAVIENSCGNQRPGSWVVDVTCGDALCNGGEDSSSCPQDCGSPPPPPGGIPTVSQWGIAIMALLLLIGGKVYFSRRRRVA